MRKFALAFACAVSSLQTAPRRCSKARRRHATPDDDDNAKWSVDVDEFAERIESAKAAVVGGLAASVAAAPSAQIMTCTPSMRLLLDGGVPDSLVDLCTGFAGGIPHAHK